MNVFFFTSTLVEKRKEKKSKGRKEGRKAGELF
jgi:hypothetical protein